MTLMDLPSSTAWKLLYSYCPRKSVRSGNISAPSLSHHAMALSGFDPISGVYAYGGTGGTAKLTLSASVQMAALEAMGDYKGTVAVYNYKTGH